MMLRSLVLFLHVSGAMGVFGALAIEGIALLQLRRAVNAQHVAAALSGFRSLRRLGGASLAATILSGMYLASTVWGWRAAWIDVAFPSLIVTAIIGATTTGPRIARLQRAAGAAGLNPARVNLDHAGSDRILWMSFAMRGAILLGIVFLMTVKPDLEESLIVIATAIVTGALAALAGLPTAARRTSAVSAA
jgi:hypothetical protein